MEENKCEKIGFVHNWKDITENIVYTTMPPSYPPKKRECINCGKKQIYTTLQREISEWQDIK